MVVGVRGTKRLIWHLLKFKAFDPGVTLILQEQEEPDEFI